MVSLQHKNAIAEELIRGGSRIPRRRGRQPSGGGWGAPTYDFAKFRKKLHEIEKTLGRRGDARRVRPLNPSLLMNTLQPQRFTKVLFMLDYNNALTIEQFKCSKHFACKVNPQAWLTSKYASGLSVFSGTD